MPTLNTHPNPLGIKALLIDLNGTLHVGNTLVEGAVRGVERLRRAGVPFVFCSNSTKESESTLIDRLGAMGLPAKPEELLTSLGACRALVAKQELRPFLLLSPDARKEFANIPTAGGHYDAVVLGLDPPSFSYDNLNTAFRILKGEPLYPESDQQTSESETTPASAQQSKSTRKPLLIAPHKANFLQAPETSMFPAGLSLGVGTYVRALEAAADVEAHTVGKPSRGFFELAIDQMRDVHGIPTEDDIGFHEIAIVGDDIVNDLGYGAQELGLKRLLVRTGKYRPGAEDRADPPPDAVYDHFGALVDALLGPES